MPTEKSTLLHNEKEKTAASPVCLTKRQNGNRRTTQFTGKNQGHRIPPKGRGPDPQRDKSGRGPQGGVALLEVPTVTVPAILRKRSV